jgi:ADP-heptose:LPS heptosyltransferase
MRIAVLNPDTIGDVIIRQPAFAAIKARGHQLTIAVRDLVAPIAGMIAPGAAVIQYPCNPYVGRFDWESPNGLEFLRKLRAADPDLLVIAPFQHTEFEESVAGFFPRVRVVGFDGLLYRDGYPPTAADSFRRRPQPLIAAALQTAETRKSELLCSAVLGENVSLPAPRLKVSSRVRAAASRRLATLGLAGEKFWCVCAGDFPGVEVRNWDAAQWAELMREIPSKFGVKLLFIGSREEHAATARILGALGEAVPSSVDLTNEPVDLDLLLGLLAESQGYIGKDTGPMHMAAALGKPVFAIFGGGTWPRFIPAATVGRVITVGVPCSGCSWHCHLGRSVCVKDVPLAAAREYLHAVLEGGLTNFESIILEPSPLASANLVREAWTRHWEMKRAIDKERSDFIQWHQDRVSDIGGLKAELAAASNRVEPSAVEAERERVRQLEQEVATIQLLLQRAETFEEIAGRVTEVEERARQLDLRAEELLAERQTIMASHRELGEAKSAVELRFAAFRRKAAERVLDARRAERLARAALEGERASAEARVCEAMANHRELAEAKNAVELRFAVFRRKAAEKVLGARHAERVARSVLEAERASAEARVCEAMAAVEADLAVEADRLRALAAEVELLRVRVADSESERLSAVAESQNLLREAQRELDSALQLIPDLRTENLAQKQELVDLEKKVDALASALKEADSDRKDLAAVRGDQAAKQALIERMDSQISIIEQDRAARGAQIETLHQIIDKLRADHALQLAAAEQRVENLRAEFAMYKSRLPIRLLRSLGLA